MKKFFIEYVPIIMTFVSGGFFWEFARYMFLSDTPARTPKEEEEDPWGIMEKGI